MPRIHRQRTVEAPPDVVWDVITDHALYGEVAPNLAAVEVVEGEGTGLVRRCVDTDGNEWTEACTRWTEGEGFAVSVNVADSDFHRPLLTRMEGEWSLEETDDGVVITIEFDFEPRYGPFGVLISKYLAWKAPSLLEAIFDRWEAAIETRLDDHAAVSDGRTSEINALYP